VLSPTTVKLESCKLTYPPTEKGKKVIKLEYRNKEGVAGGKFKKHEMYKALTENSNLQLPWVEFLREQQDDILPLKKIPTPLDDINDAMLMYYIASNLQDGGVSILDSLKGI
jgi:hypothetical protein